MLHQVYYVSRNSPHEHADRDLEIYKYASNFGFGQFGHDNKNVIKCSNADHDDKNPEN